MNKFIKLALISPLLLVTTSCGDNKKDFDFFTVEKVQSKFLELIIEASGSVEAISSIEIKSKASGEILYLGAEVGDTVKKGDVLARIDQRTPSNTLSQAEADIGVSKVKLDNASSQLERGKQLHEGNGISDKSFEDIQELHAAARAQLVRAEVYLENARIALEDTLVRSPVTGKVITRQAEVGTVITSPTAAVGGGTLLMRMADLNKVRVRSYVDEVDIGKVSIGQKVSLRVSSYKDKEFIGYVSKIEPLARVEQNVTTFPVLIDIDNKENLLLLGMTTEVEINVLNNETELTVPSGALRTRKNIRFVASLLGMSKREIKNFLEVREKNEGFTKFIVIKKVDGKPVPVWIETGATDFNNVEVLSGLKLNEEIYVVPSDGLIKNQDEFKDMLNRRRPI
ncbi:efflux RND transporter periplasmic adaptor subunit [Gammaproteobacteria bacterium]|jgi:HlyD family secretion protein|nr:efflux RND transporter periplasmic adaptor subunit [Gammaproteobacteria bacterium]